MESRIGVSSLAKKTSSKSSKKSTAKSTAKKTTAKRARTKRAASTTAAKTISKDEVKAAVIEANAESMAMCCVPDDVTDEHRVFSHIMYIIFLASAAIAAYYTAMMWIDPAPTTDSWRYFPVKALVLLGWAYFFKTFAHRIHHPHH